MAASKVIILTGASRGIGLAMAHYLLKAKHRLLLVARTAGPMEEMKALYPGQVEVLAGDLGDFAIADQAIALALSSFSRIDGLLLNHGTLDPITRVAAASAAAWRASFDTNFFSVVAFVAAALPALRVSRGRIVMTSSGAATGAYATWGAYGASKAAMNHLGLTLAVEEPDVTSVSVQPGVVDTQMQQAIREVHAVAMDEKDRKKFLGLHEEGNLLRPEQPGHVMARLVLDAPGELSGKILSWNSAELAQFQDSTD